MLREMAKACSDSHVSKTSKESPQSASSSRQQCFHIIEPEFCHAVEIGVVLVSGRDWVLALNEPAGSGDSSTNWAVDVLPVLKNSRPPCWGLRPSQGQSFRNPVR